HSEIAILVEPHLGGILNSPEATLELADRVQGLKIVLDPSHFVAMGYRQPEIEPLASIAGHVHARQARPGLIQTKMEEGIIDFPGFFGTLREHDYDHWVTIEYEHETGTNSQYDDVLSETVKMRDCFRAWLG
ncbi:MAG: TIM barrel protein, partial [Pseudomonadota bacterium]